MSQHSTGPLFEGFNQLPGIRETQLVASFGGTHPTTANSSVPAGARLPFGLYPEATAFSDARRGVWDTAFGLWRNFIPATLLANLIAASQSPGAGAIVLASANVAGANTPSAPALTVLIDSQGKTRLRLDTPRLLNITSGGVDTGITFTIKGFDEWNVPMTETITGASGAAAAGKKAWYDIVSVTHTGSVAGTVTIGTIDTFGLPYRADNYALTDWYWNDVIQLVAQFTAPDLTSPATAITGDVRGTYAAPNASNGTKTMQLFGTVPQSASQDITKLLGVTQFS